MVTFPGTLDHRDAAQSVRLAGGTVVELWHDDADLKNVDAVIIPGGFSYGDYLRAGAIAAKAPVMRSVIDAANAAGTLRFRSPACSGYSLWFPDSDWSLTCCPVR